MVLPSKQRSDAAVLRAEPSAAVDHENLRELRRSIRSAERAALAGRYYPPALWAFRGGQRLRTDYPLIIGQGGDQATTFSRWAEQTLATLGGDGASIVRDNLKRLELALLAACQAKGGAIAAQTAIAQAGVAVEKELGLSDARADQLRNGLTALSEQIDAGAQFVGPSANVAEVAAVAAATLRGAERWTRFVTDVQRLLEQLRTLTRLDRERSESGRSDSGWSSRIGSAGAQLIDPQRLAKVVGQHRGTTLLPAERRAHMEQLVDQLEPALAAAPAAYVLIADRELSNLGNVIVDPDPCRRAQALFEEQATKLCRLIAAVRAAELELAEAYDAARHGPWLERLGFTDLTAEEVALLPRFVVSLGDGKLSVESISALLGSRRPLQVIVHVRGASQIFAPGLEPGYLGIAHREATVQQTSLARPTEIYAGVARALATQHPSLHVVFDGNLQSGEASPIGSWLHARAAEEARAHVGFFYDPAAGKSWARRMRIDENSQSDSDWPTHQVPWIDGDGEARVHELPFTFADYALLDPAYAECFVAVNANCADAPELVPLAAHLSCDDVKERGQQIPFVWGADESGRMRRLAVRRELVALCEDRLSYWNTLQELAGVHNEHVLTALADLRVQLAQDAAQERERLAAEHAAELERVRDQTAAEAMQRLAEALVSGEALGALSRAAGTLSSASAPAAPLASAAEVKVESPAEQTAAAPEEDAGLSFDEPFIDSALCTSCNDCINVNPLLFVYNENKQATLGDVSKGTFADLVKAAEACPARCIHPGKPQNSAEPNLEALIARAAPFN